MLKLRMMISTIINLENVVSDDEACDFILDLTCSKQENWIIFLLAVT